MLRRLLPPPARRQRRVTCASAREAVRAVQRELAGSTLDKRKDAKVAAAFAEKFCNDRGRRTWKGD